MKQIEKTAPSINEFGPGQTTGNKAASETASKVKAALDAIPVDRDALLLAEHNDVLDHAIARLGENGENWITGYLAIDKAGFQIITTQTEADEITEEFAQSMRERGEKFCLVGAVGAELGPHSYEAVNQAIRAVARVVSSDGRYSHAAYGFASGGVYVYNDDYASPEEIVYALQEAKKQPLRND